MTEYGPGRGEEYLELSLDTFLTVTREDQFPLELAQHLSLEQCQQLIPQGPGGWRKISAILMCLLRYSRSKAKREINNLKLQRGKREQI